MVPDFDSVSEFQSIRDEALALRYVGESSAVCHLLPQPQSPEHLVVIIDH